MSQLAPSDTPPDATAPQDEAWTRLLHLETQVQLTQASLTHHTAELSTLHQTTKTISESLQALLERLNPTLPAATATPVVELTAGAPMHALGSPATQGAPHIHLPQPLPDAYDSERATGEQFLQSCLTYIQLCGDDFVSDDLKVVWVLSYMKSGRAATYALRVF